MATLAQEVMDLKTRLAHLEAMIHCLVNDMPPEGHTLPGR